MKIKKICTCIAINLLALIGFANFQNNNIAVADANITDYYATTLNQNGDIDYVTYSELSKLDISVTDTSAYIPEGSIDESSLSQQGHTVNPRLIFGDDERCVLTNPTSYSLFPYRAVCYIKAYDTNSSSWHYGTGVLVGPSTVLTACHVIYKKDKTWYQNYEIIPGAYCINGSVQSAYPTISSFNKLTVGNYRDTGNFNDDWAILDLNSDIGNTVGYF